jgi:phthalate 4,5-dioxygenase
VTWFTPSQKELSMLTKEQNERLCRVGPGTPMGTLFRRYWLPVCTADKLTEPGGAPRAVRLLGQDLVVFRGRDGKIGVLDEFCIHRGASLALGRVEECGLRCLYHGWSFGTDGSIIDMMNIPAEKRSPKLKARAYPVVEEGGLIWTYLGPKEKQPAFRRYAYMDLPEENRVVLMWKTKANWVQMLEGGLDSSHVSILHTNAARPGWAGTSDKKVGAMDDTGPSLEIEDTQFGYHYAAFRKGGNGAGDNVRITPFIMPSGRIIPGGALLGYNSTLILEVPIDDEHTATYTVRYADRPMKREDRLRETGLDNPDIYSQETQEFLFSRQEFHKQRRDLMETDWSGFRGISTEDAVIAVSMGPLYDRSKENLISSDLAVVRMRRRLLDSVDRMERGLEPVGFEVDGRSIEAVDTTPPDSAHWRTLVPSHKTEEPA